MRRRLNHLFTIVVMFFLIFLTSCAFPTSPTFTNYDSLTLSDQQVATLENWNLWGCPSCVDQILRAEDGTLVYDKERDGRVSKIKLTPGNYLIRFSYHPHKIPTVFRAGTAELKAGHVYRVKEKSCYEPEALFAAIFGGACRGRGRATLWIEDDTTGEVVAGEKWD